MMNDVPPSSSDKRPATEASTSGQEADSTSWDAGRSAGLAWAAEEARRGYVHPLRLEPGARKQLIIEHAQAVFGGRTRGQSRPFIRGFVEGVAEYWRAHEAGAGPPEEPK